MLVVIPNDLRDRLNASIDTALAGRPCDEMSREYLYNWLLLYWDEHGTIPEFKLQETFQTRGAN